MHEADRLARREKNQCCPCREKPVEADERVGFLGRRQREARTVGSKQARTGDTVWRESMTKQEVGLSWKPSRISLWSM